MSRKSDRDQVFRLVFAIEFNDLETYEELFRDYKSNFNQPFEVDWDFVKREYFGVVKNIKSIDPLISKYSSGWEMSRISKVDLAAMRLAVYEMLYSGEIPMKVAINEALELSKVYSGKSKTPFINGVLAQIAPVKDDKPAEGETGDGNTESKNTGNGNES